MIKQLSCGVRAYFLRALHARGPALHTAATSAEDRAVAMVSCGPVCAGATGCSRHRWLWTAKQCCALVHMSGGGSSWKEVIGTCD